MKIGIPVRSKEDCYFIKKRYLSFISDYQVIFLYPYYNTRVVFEECDGFIIVGGDDANPKLYNEENFASLNISDEIDELDLLVIDYAFCHQKPILGICRGLQMINIYFKGSLKQHVFNHDTESHKILLVENFLDFSNCEIVNSFHHQAVKKLGNDLRVLYYSVDGEVECLIHNIYPIIAVQFHPEMDMENGFYNKILGYYINLLKIYKK